MTVEAVGQVARQTKRKKPTMAFVIISVVWAILLAPIAIFSAMTGMIADGPGDPNKMTIVFVLFMAWPVLVILAVVAAWFAFRFNRMKLGWVCMATPALWPIVPSLAYSILLGSH